MWDAGAIGGRVELKTGGWERGVNRVKTDAAGLKRTLTGFGSDLTNAAKKLGLIGTAAQAAFGLMARHAMHIEEAENLFEVSFGNMADDVRQWSESVADSLAMTAAQIREGAGVFAVMTQSMGLSESAATSLSKNMTMLAADMASFYNLGHEEALQKLQAGLTGEAEPLKRLGILVNENTTAQWAWANGVAAAGEQLTDQQKVIARYGSIMEQTSKAQGDLWRTADSTTNQLRRLKAQFSDITADLGTMLLPAINRGVHIINNIVDVTRSWYEGNKELVGGLFVAGAGALTVLSGLTAMGFIIGPLAESVRFLGHAFVVAWGKAIAPILPLLAAISAVSLAAYTLRAVWKQNVGGIKTEWERFISGWKGGVEESEKKSASWLDSLESGFKKTLDFILEGLSAIPQGLAGLAEFVHSLFYETPFDFDKAIREGARAAETPFLEWFTRPLRDGSIDKEVENLKEVAGGVAEQFKEDWENALEWFKGQFPELSSTIQSLLEGSSESGGYEYEPIDIGALMEGLSSTEGIGEAARKTAREAATEIDRMADAGERLYLSLDPVAGAVDGIRERLAQLEAAGRLNAQTRSLLGPALWKELESVSEETLKQILGQVGQFDILLTQSIIHAREEAAKLRTSMAAEELIATIQPDEVRYFEDLRSNIELLKEAGRLDDETTNLLAAYSWEEMRGLSTEALDELIGMLYSAGGAYAEAAARVEELRGEQAGLGVELANTAGRLMDLGYKVNQVSDTIDSGIGRKLGAVVTSISGISTGIGEAVAAFKTLASSGKASIASTIASVAQLGSGVLGAVGAVMTLAEAFGLVGDEAEEVKTGWAKVMDELEGQLDEWADRLTDTIIEFVKTGEFELDKFLQGVAEDILRTTITTMFTQPLMGFIGGGLGFAKGAAFAGGEVIPFAKGGIATAPAYFPMRGGKTGLLGEAGPEAIMPLRRTNDGSLGVRATAAETTVNVIDQRGAGSPPVDVQRRKTADGGEEIRILIRDAIADSIARGELDGLLGLTYGLQRGRA